MKQKDQNSDIIVNKQSKENQAAEESDNSKVILSEISTIHYGFEHIADFA